jgi:hypothetical protein
MNGFGKERVREGHGLGKGTGSGRARLPAVPPKRSEILGFSL